MVERDRLELERAVAQEAVLPAVLPQQHDGRADLLADRRDGRALVEVLAAVAVRVDREQHLGLDLPEAVAHAAGAELRRGRRPHGAERRGREERGDRVGHVRQVGGDAVAATDAARGQTRPDPRGALPQLPPRPLPQRLALGGEVDRHALVGLAAEQPLRVVHRRAREPHGAGHRPVREHTVERAARLEALPDRRPEALDVLDRPAPERVVVRRAERGREPRHVRMLPQRRRRLPQQLAVLHRPRCYGVRAAHG
jgi:hypothetical protein